MGKAQLAELLSEPNRSIGAASTTSAPDFHSPSLGANWRTTYARLCGSVTAWRKILLPILFALCVLWVWQEQLRQFHVSPLILPPPSAVLQTLLQDWPILVQQSVPTIIDIVTGFGIAAFIGIGCGFLFMISQRLQQILYPHLLIMQLVPKIALAPLFVVWLGVGSSSRLAFAVFLSFFPIIVSVRAGLLSADRHVLRLARALTATPWQTFWSVRIPYATPHVFTGLKVGLTMAMIGVIIGEFVTAQAGLGYIILFATSSAQTVLAFAALFMLCVIGLLLYGLVVAMECGANHLLGAHVTSQEM